MASSYKILSEQNEALFKYFSCINKLDEIGGVLKKSTARFYFGFSNNNSISPQKDEKLLKY